MLQIDLKTFASDALEDAMRLAQTKAINSFTWSDQFTHLNYCWRDIYDRIAMIDSGFYSKIERIDKMECILPPFVRNAVRVFHAKHPNDPHRIIYKSSGMEDLGAPFTYHISGNTLYIPDATKRTVFLEYVPQPAVLFFPMYNRDPILPEEEVERETSDLFNMYQLKLYRAYKNGEEAETLNGKTYAVVSKDTPEEAEKVILVNRREVYMWPEIVRVKIDGTDSTKNPFSPDGPRDVIDLSNVVLQNTFFHGEERDWKLVFISCDYPYIFCTYQHTVMTEKYCSGFFNKDFEWNNYNPFDFTGRESNVEYVKVSWNDKTGLGATIIDHNDNDKQKTLGWTPDSLINYPSPDVYRYLVARLADKFSALNESNILGVQKELIDAQYAFEAFLEKDKVAFHRIDNVVGTTWGDWL